MHATTPAATPVAAPRLPGQHGPSRSSTGSSSLHEHLVRDHGRAPHEIAGLPLPDVHRLEHVDQTMSLLQLGHRHANEESAG